MLEKLENNPKTERYAIIIILIVALIHGLIYVFIMPPWQHYDEPNHFEYIWLLAERGDIPERGDFDREMRREVALSMRENHFFPDVDAAPSIEAEKPWIGTHDQTDEQPLYYYLASIPLRLLKDADVTTQMYAARFVSLLFYLVTVLAAWGVASELTRPKHPLRILLPLAVALVPAFTDVMTAVNNDSAAIAIFSLFLWGCMRLLRRDFSWLTLLWIGYVVKYARLVGGPFIVQSMGKPKADAGFHSSHLRVQKAPFPLIERLRNRIAG